LIGSAIWRVTRECVWDSGSYRTRWISGDSASLDRAFAESHRCQWIIHMTPKLVNFFSISWPRLIRASMNIFRKL
jgi:hypothetical protein